MNDIRNEELARVLIHHSLKLKAGEKVLIRGNGFSTEPLVSAVMAVAREVGA